MSPVTINNTTLELVQGDITELQVDAIVCPSNTNLILGAGVAGAIARKGGPSIQDECNRIAHLEVGEATLTKAGDLPARYIIHAVGPRMGEGEEDTRLASATANSIQLAQKKELRSIAFPAISTGIFGFPMDRCAQIMLGETLRLMQQGLNLEKIIFCLFDAPSLRTFKQTLRRLKKTLEEQPTTGK